MSVKASLILSGRGLDVARTTEELGIFPACGRDTFPVNSIAEPYWYTEVEANSNCIEDPLNALKERVSPRLATVLRLCVEYGLKPTVLIVIRSAYGDRPELTLSPEMVEFFHHLGAEVCFDIGFD